MLFVCQDLQKDTPEQGNPENGSWTILSGKMLVEKWAVRPTPTAYRRRKFHSAANFFKIPTGAELLGCPLILNRFTPEKHERCQGLGEKMGVLRRESDRTAHTWDNTEGALAKGAAKDLAFFEGSAPKRNEKVEIPVGDCCFLHDPFYKPLRCCDERPIRKVRIATRDFYNPDS